MYGTILVTLDGTPTDRAIVEHVKPLALLMHSRIVLLHVADGWAARTFGPDAISPEIADDQAYLGTIRRKPYCSRLPMATHASRHLPRSSNSTAVQPIGRVGL